MIRNGSLSTGLHNLDTILHGGFSRGSLIGLHGSGLFLATQLSIIAQLPESKGGLESQVLWFEYERFPADVLRNVAHRFSLSADTAINSIVVSKTQLDITEGFSLAVEEGVQFIVVEDLYRLGNQPEGQRKGLALLKNWACRVKGVCVVVNPLRPLIHDAALCWSTLSPVSSDYTLHFVPDGYIADIDKRPVVCDKLVGISLDKGPTNPLVWVEACQVDGGLFDCKNYGVGVNA
ncbi:MAG: hypothetical protein E4H14_13875 [Candidatus Thorarchaeota archaeon]|nr:MAG: hypothetical protein E4H14_13875 [Candidatus Thorarchaeota archaeon]